MVVTGGANGIGRALCLRFAKEGAKFIAVSDVDEANGKTVANEIEKGRAGFFPCDVSQEAQVENLVDAVSRRGRPDGYLLLKCGHRRSRRTGSL